MWEFVKTVILTHGCEQQLSHFISSVFFSWVRSHRDFLLIEGEATTISSCSPAKMILHRFKYHLQAELEDDGIWQRGLNLF